MNVIDTTENCRYCLMCRHICPVTRATYNEASSPHGWALTIASVRRGLLDWNAETADLLYQCADCGACQAACVTDQPLPQAIVAARAQVVAAGQAPPAVAEIDAELRQSLSATYADHATPADVAIFAGAGALPQYSASLGAARTLLEQANVAHTAIGAGRESGYLAYTLGLHDTARELARATAEESVRAGCRTIIALSAEDAHALLQIYPLLGAPLPDGLRVVELTTLLAELLEADRLRLGRADVNLAYHDPCQTLRLPGRWHAPRTLLAALTGRPAREGFWREGRAASCGASGGLPFTQPKLAEQLARRALVDLTASGASTLVTDSPGCLAHLRAHAAPGVEVLGLYELLANHILSS